MAVVSCGDVDRPTENRLGRHGRRGCRVSHSSIALPDETKVAARENPLPASRQAFVGRVASEPRGGCPRQEEPNIGGGDILKGAGGLFCSRFRSRCIWPPLLSHMFICC